MGKQINIGIMLAMGGLIPAFFLMGPAVFADAAAGERATTLAVACLIYLVLGAAAGYWTVGKPAGIWLGLPAVIVALLFGELPLSLVAGAAALAAAWLGSYGGAWLRAKRR